MTRAVFWETLRRGWRAGLFWGIGIGLVAVLNIVAVPDARGMQATAQAITKMGAFVVQLVGGGDVAFLASPAGFLNNQYYSIILLVFAVYAILAGLDVTATEEDKGILDLLLSMPVPRHRVVVEKFLGYGVLAVGVVTVSTAFIFLSLGTEPAVKIPTSTVIEASLYLVPGTLIVMAFTAFVASRVRRRRRAAAVAVVFLVASWFIDVLGRTATTSFVHSLRVFSFYAYYDTASVMQRGLSAVDLGVPLAATAILVAGTVLSFQRRNIGA